jgi:hypothetical protein
MIKYIWNLKVRITFIQCLNNIYSTKNMLSSCSLVDIQMFIYIVDGGNEMLETTTRPYDVSTQRMTIHIFTAVWKRQISSKLFYN